MNPHDQAKLDAIERDRRKREDAILLALLLLSDEARRDSLVALKHGIPFQPIVQNVVSKATGIYANAMADAHRAGVWRMGQLAGETLDRDASGTAQTLATVYRPAAEQASIQIVKSITEAIEQRDRALPLRASLKDAFDTAGYTVRHPFAIESGAERAIVGAHNGGMMTGAQFLNATVLGLRHVSVIDEATTHICRERDGLRLPVRDEFWTWNIPPLHWGCRSTVVPITDEFTPSSWRPLTPPAAGFGDMSAVFLRRLGVAA